MKAWMLSILGVGVLMLGGCDAIQKKMAAEQAYQQKQKTEQEAIESRWKFNPNGYDLSVHLSDSDLQGQTDSSNIALITSDVLREVAGFPHLNLLQEGGNMGTIRIHYELDYQSYQSEDNRLRWEIPVRIHTRIEIESKTEPGNWEGIHEAVSERGLKSESVVETMARSLALSQMRLLIEDSVQKITTRLGKYEEKEQDSGE